MLGRETGSGAQGAWVVMQAKLCLLAAQLLLSCCAPQFLTGHGLVISLWPEGWGPLIYLTGGQGLNQSLGSGQLEQER